MRAPRRHSRPRILDRRVDRAPPGDLKRWFLVLTASLAVLAVAACDGGGDESTSFRETAPNTGASTANSAPDDAGGTGTAPPAGTVVTPAPETLPPENMPEVVRPEGGVTAPGDPPPTLPPDTPGSPGAADPAGPSA